MSEPAGTKDRRASKRAPHRSLEDELASRLAGTLAFVGVGDAARGDDGAGPMLAGLLAAAGLANVIDAGASPEIETWRIRGMRPDTVLFVDAVDMGAEPGDASLIRTRDLRADACDTHRAPVRLTMEYVERELGCRCLLLAIQPREIGRGAAMSDEVKASVGILADMIIALGGTSDRREQ